MPTNRTAAIAIAGSNPRRIVPPGEQHQHRQEEDGQDPIVLDQGHATDRYPNEDDATSPLPEVMRVVLCLNQEKQDSEREQAERHVFRERQQA